MKSFRHNLWRVVVVVGLASPVLAACSDVNLGEDPGASDLAASASDRDWWGALSCATLEETYRQDAVELSLATGTKPEERALEEKRLGLRELGRRNHCLPPLEAGCAAHLAYLLTPARGFPQGAVETIVKGRAKANGWDLTKACTSHKGQGCKELVRLATSAPADLTQAITNGAPSCFGKKQP